MAFVMQDQLERQQDTSVRVPSRTAALWADFADAFVGADVAAITDVYAAGETPRPGVSGKLVVQAVLDAHPWARVAYLPRRRDVITFLRSELRAGDLCLTLGAGDLTSLPDELQALIGRAEITEFLNTRSPAYRRLGLTGQPPGKAQAIALMVQDPNLIKPGQVLRIPAA